MDQPQANKWIGKIEQLLHRALKAKSYLPTRTPEQLYDLLIEKGEQHILLDATERRINRSVDDDIQREQYSGKKKEHTVKNNVITNFDDQILYLSPTYDGSVHDKQICNEEPLMLPKGINLWQDTGYQGHQPENLFVLKVRAFFNF